MKWNTVIGTVVIVAAVGGIAWYAASRPAPVENLGVKVSVPAGIAKIAEDAPYYTIDISYPTTTPLMQTAGIAADTAAVAAIKGYLDDYVAAFKKSGNFANLTPKDIEMMGYSQGRKESLQAAFLVSLSVRSVSYIYSINMDTLGAHPNLFFHTFTFDLATGKQLALADIFANGAPYLTRLSGIARSKLPAIIGADMVDAQMLANGTTPEEKSFANFFLDNGNLTLLFAPYDVAAFAAGPQTLHVPLSSLSDILRPEYEYPQK